MEYRPVNAQPSGANITLHPVPVTGVKSYYDHKSRWVTGNSNSAIATAAGSFQSELGCGRILALGDDAFANAGLDWNDNDTFMRGLLHWVTQGQPCSPPRVYRPVIIR